MEQEAIRCWGGRMLVGEKNATCKLGKLKKSMIFATPDLLNPPALDNRIGPKLSTGPNRRAPAWGSANRGEVNETLRLTKLEEKIRETVRKPEAGGKGGGVRPGSPHGAPRLQC